MEKREQEMNYFELLNKIDVSDKLEKIETKTSSLTYLSWAWAWMLVKTKFPDTTYKVYEREVFDKEGRLLGPVPYFTDGVTGWVKTGVTVNGIEHIEWLPIMTNNHRSIIFEAITSVDVNTAVQRCLTKAIARHGLGLYIYAGEDLPLDEEDKKINEELMQQMKQASLMNDVKVLVNENINEKSVEEKVEVKTTKEEKPVKKVEKQENKPVSAPTNDTWSDIMELKKAIGALAKVMKQNGQYDLYLTIIRDVYTQVTGKEAPKDYKVMAAPDEDKQILIAIYDRLQKESVK